MDSPSSSSNHVHAPNQEPTSQPQPHTPDSDFPEGEQPVKMEIVTTPIPARRPLSYPESPPLRTRPPSPNLYRLVPAYQRPAARDDISDGDISESEESPSPVRPADMPRTYTLPYPEAMYQTTPESQSSSLEPDEHENALLTNRNDTPATMPPETPLTQMADTPQPMAQAQTPKNPFFRHVNMPTGRTTSEPPQERPQLAGLAPRPLSPATSIKAEPSEATLPASVTPAPPAPDSKQGDMETKQAQPVASTSQQPPQPPVPAPNPARRTTRGSLAAAAAAASESEGPPKRPTPEPGAPVRASITTWIITTDRTWLLPQPRLGVSLAQIVPPDVEAPQWMRFTRAPIVWDGKTDAGGKSGRNLVLIGAAAAKAAVNGRLVTPTRNESVDAEQTPTSPEDSSNVPLEGLHLLMDYRADEKPSYSYALITRFAILGSPFKSLSLGEIYTMLEAKFPWFARDDSKWRDSIRYNLSSNNWFVKTKRALHQPGVGNLWMVDEESTGGPKRPRKGRGKGSAFMDPDDEDEDGSGDEPGPSIISTFDGIDQPTTSRNGTLMLTFDSKARVPLDRNQGQRGVTAHASHNLIPRIVTRQIVMSAVDQAFASPSATGEPYVDPREKAVQALNNVPFSLASGDPRDEPRPPKGKSVTRAAAKEEQKQHPPPPFQTEFPVVPIQTTPAPPWLSSSGAANGESANDEGIGSGKDDEESLNADEEGLTPEDYWFAEPNNAGAEGDVQGPEEHHQMEDPPGHSQGQEIDMVDQPAHAPAIPASAEPSRPAAPVDFGSLKGLSDAALNEHQGGAKYSFSQATKSPDGFLVQGKQLSPRIINGVLTMRRQANYLDDSALFPDVPPVKQPPAPPPDPPATQPPSFASRWSSAEATPSQGVASTSTAGGSGQQGRSMWGSAATQSNGPFVPSLQSQLLQAARQGQIGGPNGAGDPLDRPQGYGPYRAEPAASTSVRKRPQLAKLAPAASSSSGNIVDAPPGPLAFRLPLSIKTPPTTRRPLTPNAPPGDRPAQNNTMPMSPYAPPPDSRKRKTMPQSPNANGRLSLDARQQKVRRIEIDTERRRRVNKINPVFNIGQGSEMAPAQASLSNPSASTGYHRLPPSANQAFNTSRTSKIQGVIGFATPVTNKTYATPAAGGTGLSSAGASTSKEPAGPAFGQSGFMFKGAQPSAPNTVGNQGSGNVFSQFSSQAGPSFRSTAAAVPGSGTSQVSTDSMDLDDDDERPFKMVKWRMDTDGSDEEDNGRSGTRNIPANRRETDMHRAGPPNNHGIFAQASNRAGSTLSISVPVSSSRMERGAPGSNMVSPTSASRDSPILAPMVHTTPGTSTQSPRLPSINSLLRHSPARESRDSLPPIQMAYPQGADPAPTQPTSYRPTPAHSRTQSSTSDARGSSSAQSPQTPLSRHTVYYGFLTASRSGAMPQSGTTPVYSGGDENDLAEVIYHKSDWRD